jgi:uncharacterized glyoxalase superfamily protein PhnB
MRTHDAFISVPQRMTTVTLGARSVPSLRAFYQAIGWRENEGSDDTFTSFTMGSVRLALYPIEMLHGEAAPGEPVPTSSWNGTTLALNVATREDVDDGVFTAVAAGASAIGAVAEREWGGYSGYFADPEGQRWEIAWAPWLTDFE